MGRPGLRAQATGEYGVRLVRGPFVKLEQHPETVTSERSLLAAAKRTSKPTAVDLFCGAGGLSLGLQAAGFDVLLGVDTDEEAVETHRHHHGGMSVNWDLGDQEVIDKIARFVRDGRVTLVAGGPPCQAFSKAGRSMLRDLVRQGRRPQHDLRRDLWQSFLQVVERSMPPAVVMENVPDMALDRDMMILRTMVERLEELGYSVEEKLVDTWRYGVPQWRQRLLLVALRDGVRFAWPKESDRTVTVRNAIGDLPVVEAGWRPDGGAEGWAPYERPVSTFQKKMRAAMRDDRSDRVYDHITRPVRDDDLLVFEQMDSKTKYSDVADHLKRYRDDIFDDKYKRLDWDEVSRTITAHIAKDGYWYIHPEQHRTLTIREAARIQTFPDDFRFSGSPSAAFRQIGNAVPPVIGETIGGAILESLGKRERNRFSTLEVSSRLSEWFAAAGAVHRPWLVATQRWTVLQAELLLDRATPVSRSSMWPLLAKLATPMDTIANGQQLREMASWIGRELRADDVLVAAAWFNEHPEALDSIEEMTKCPGVMPAMAELAVRVCPDPSEDPVVATQPALRVAARFFGEPVDKINKRSNGRMAIARLIGAGEIGERAHLGLLELGERVCTTKAPACDDCPLDTWCASARPRPQGPRRRTNAESRIAG
jgi:DNA (cytosine-5)-methyltransferase 1